MHTLRLYLRFPRLQRLAARAQRDLTSIALRASSYDHATAGIGQIALVTVPQTGPVTALHGRVNPQRRRVAEHRGVDRDAADEPTFAHWATIIGKIALTTVTGFNLALFDLPLIHAQCLRYGIDAPTFSNILDLHEVLASTTGSYSGQLQDHARHYGVSLEQDPDAVDDAVTTLQLAERIAEEHGDAVLSLLPAPRSLHAGADLAP